VRRIALMLTVVAVMAAAIVLLAAGAAVAKTLPPQATEPCTEGTDTAHEDAVPHTIHTVIAHENIPCED